MEKDQKVPQIRYTRKKTRTIFNKEYKKDIVSKFVYKFQKNVTNIKYHRSAKT